MITEDNARGLALSEYELLKKLNYDKEKDTIVADASLQVKPSTVYLGSAFGMSNAVQAVGFRLADGTDALCLVNRFDKDGGSYSNPRFFALGQSSTLNVNLVDNVIMSEPIEVSYTTAGDNLTYSFEIKPASVGRLRAQYWLGEDDEGAPVVDFHRDITQAEVDGGQPVMVEPNFYVLKGGSKLFVRFTGVDLKGNGTQPWFRSKILPFKEAQFSGHCDYMDINTNVRPYIGGTYFARTNLGNINVVVEPTFKDTFTIVDYLNEFTGTRYAQVDFSAFGQRPVRLSNAGDSVEFFRMKAAGENELWWYRNHRDGSVVRIPIGTAVLGTLPPPPEPPLMRDLGVYPSSGTRTKVISHRAFTATMTVSDTVVVLRLSAAERMRVTGTIQSSDSEPYKWNILTSGNELQVGIISKAGGINNSHYGKLLVSTVGSPENHVVLEWFMHNNDSDEYAFFVKME
ncbi:hypothetical protein NMR53_003254 [Vibrio cholerae]|nr:hypothetical protein [Vibrio cholerae]